MTDAKYLKRTIVKEEIESNYLNEKRTLRVYLPPGYQAWISYPVVYCQDGEDFFNFGRVATLANQLILDEELEPFIIVGVEVDKKVRTSEYSPVGERHQSYVQFFAHELIPYIEGKYPIRSDLDSRILAGDSLGGSVSVHIALQYPNLFQNVISLSGAYYPDSQSIIAAEPDLSWLRLYMIVGLQEDVVVTDHGTFDFVTFNRDTRDIFLARSASVHYLERDGQHVWGFWQQYIPDTLKHFLK
ncbi:alpha/beta hydrolase-fold protein [Paenibacillus terrigena]|uniref:alpha/beta hydrolase n=1 Tax=Paenibacillus terrigena TaxID=369333 RepID=UPI0028D8E0C8|nr:alpha/beta hydrolase-fold protein [Paenibacillus terrigena]